ncbi:glycerol acyltransferase [Brenneria izadpanahii]|uniref:Glycerol acyltransferase n=1 Tax=Brenneria izadpanahii TaxID=2722756 RepID=A0ABX7UNX6_9GAMM|nr:glycerol acyltransferase [Brenneria izadpanahii]QTF06960.1 glycerol acyltransferase [Brenneria izadpanahii]
MKPDFSRQTPGYLQFTPGRPLSLWHRCIARLLVRFYYSSLRFVTPYGRPLASFDGETPTLLLASHRNGATDGWIFNQLLPTAQFLTSVQLLRSRFLRLMFAGIPVVRDKDRVRYGYSRAQAGNPILQAIAHLKLGGSVIIFPEGTSEWGPGPQPYQEGAAKIIRRLMQEQCRFQVIVAGSFYQAPDRFGSALELLVSDPLALPEQGEDSIAHWEMRIMQSLSCSLDRVSVTCRDEPMLERVARQACYRSRIDGSYALAFKQAEQQALKGRAPEPTRAETSRASMNILQWVAWTVFIFTLLPVWLCGWWAGRRADGRNTTTFFRLAGGFGMALVWLPCLAVAAFIYPWLLPLYGVAVWGWRQRGKFAAMNLE